MEKQSEIAGDFDAVVVGAGFTGLYQLHKFRELGLNVRVFEAGSGVGGTWYWNRYPGARTDSESRVYQYWFSDELLEEWDWSERFPAQEETERYLNYVADKFDLKRDISFNSRVMSADYDEAAQRWLITTENGETVSCQFLVMGSGGLTIPKLPDIPGVEDFRGTVVHTSRWPGEGIDLKGKRVGVIGTGATGIQVIQTIAEEVGHLTVFQRTPNFAIPMHNPKFDDAIRSKLRSEYPVLRDQVHGTFGGHSWDFREGAFLELNQGEREEKLKELWDDGSLRFWVGSYMDLFFEEEASEEFSQFVAERIRARVKDPAVADKLVPTNHGFGSRRVPLEVNYYEAFNRDNVTLIDLNEDPFDYVDETGIFTSSGHHQLDVLICATGFDAGTGALTAVDIHGRDGRLLRDQWNTKGVSTYLGLQVSGYPNFFMVMGPMSPAAAFCNVPTCIQQQVDWITDCVSFVLDKGAQAIEPTAAAESAWGTHHDEIASDTLVAKTDSWYTGTNIEGKPKRLLAYIGGVQAYRVHCDEAKDSGYANCQFY